jgi:hypothetical protein
MSCCGQNRQAWREWPARNTRVSDQPAAILQNPSVLYPLGQSSLVVKGAVTGHTYLFGSRGTELSVDGRDVPALIATGWFSASAPEN